MVEQLTAWVAWFWVRFDKLTFQVILLFFVVAWFGWLVRRLRKLLGDLVDQLKYQLDTFRQQLLAIRETVEERQSPPGPIEPANGGDASTGRSAVGGARPAENAKANWEIVRSQWADARDRIELTIDGLDGRRRRKYAAIPRYSYEKVITTLRSDGVITAKAQSALLEMNRLFLAYRSAPGGISTDICQTFQEKYRTADGELTKLSST